MIVHLLANDHKAGRFIGVPKKLKSNVGISS